MDFGRRIKAWREHLGMSQKALAAAIGVVPGTVCMWESEDYDSAPTRRNLEKLLALFGINELRFWGALPKPKAKKKPAPPARKRAA